MKISKTFKKIAAWAGCIAMAVSFAACNTGKEPGGGPSIEQIPDATEMSWRSAGGSNVYTEENLAYPFFSDQTDAITYFCNAMYKSYGYLTPSNQPFVGLGVGWCPAWYEWIALTRNWSDNEWAKETWRNYLINCPMSEDGYVWSYDTPHWPDLGYTDSHHNFHYDSNFRFVITVINFCSWENSLDLLSETDGDTVADDTEANEGTYHQDEDVSEGMTVLEKFDSAIEYIMTELHGEDGLIIIDENANDGLNLGTTDSYSSNYWDNIPFGYKDAYENILFYNMLNQLGDFEIMRGDSEKSAYYLELAETVKKNYNDTFWVEATGRYAGTVDVNGVVRDYGLTFVNTEAVTAGLAGEEQAEQIYQWLDGERIVEGDTSTGEDIYEYIAAPRTNTIDFAAVSDANGNNKYWWHDNNGGQALSGNGSYGYHLENGGAILYTEYYDLMGRFKMFGSESALDRLILLAEEYAKDELARDPMNPVSGGLDVLGFIGEFPESGLVPTVYLYGFLGVSVGSGGLVVSPDIPEQYGYMGAKDLVFGGNNYNLTVYRNGNVKLEGVSALDLTLTLADYAEKDSVAVTLYDANDNIVSISRVTAENGKFTIDLNGASDSEGYVIIQ